MEWNRFDDESKCLEDEGYYLVAAEQGEGEDLWFDMSFKYIAFPEDDIPKIARYFTHWMRVEQPKPMRISEL